jgi:hypothetical protein
MGFAHSEQKEMNEGSALIGGLAPLDVFISELLLRHGVLVRAERAEKLNLRGALVNLQQRSVPRAE